MSGVNFLNMSRGLQLIEKPEGFAWDDSVGKGVRKRTEAAIKSFNETVTACHAEAESIADRIGYLFDRIYR